MTDRSREWVAAVRKQIEILQEHNLDHFISKTIYQDIDKPEEQWKITFERKT